MNKQKLYNPKIMGIVNVTPDSFSDGGEYFDTNRAVAHGITLASEGADILDIGGESTRPSAKSISVEEELRRVIPVIEQLRAAVDTPLSIDTRNAEVMKQALHAGASMVNDVSALTYDGTALSVVSQLSPEVCLMHMQGTPADMQTGPSYAHGVVEEVFQYLSERVAVCVDAGIQKESIYCDVGIGFGKTVQHNRELLKNILYFKKLGTRIILGTSRKSFIPHLSKNTPPQERIGGSLASIVHGLHAQVDMFRVHDVATIKQFIDVYTAIDSV